MTSDIAHRDLHRPTDAFREFLDGEVRRTFRRDRSRIGMRLAAVVIVSMALGLTGGLASAQVRESSQRESILDAARADAMLVQVRLELARAQLAESRRAVAAGAASKESAAVAEQQVKEREAQLGRVAANIDEITATAKPPRDELNAPIVNGRDFVKERIQLQLMTAQQQLQSAEAAQVEAARRVRAGASSTAASMEAQLDVARATREMVVLAGRLSLRKEFLEKATPVEQLARRLEETELRQDAVVAQQALELARVRAALVEKSRAAGAVGDLEVMRAQLEMKEREIELQRLMRRAAHP